jgi:serine/threonine-protein kinase
VTRLIRRCLRRDPRNRLQHVGDARIELVDLDTDAERSSEIAAAPTTRRWLLWPLVAAAASLAAAVLGALYFWRPAPPAKAPAARLSLELPAPLRMAAEYATPFAIAPSGALLAVEATEGETRRLYLRELRDPTLRPVAGSEGAWQPFFSPDGQWVAFFNDRKLVKVAVAGGSLIELADVGGNARGGTWAADGSIVFSAPQTAGLRRVPDRGGQPAALTTLDRSRDEYSHRWPDAVPDTPWVIFTVGFQDATFDEGRIDAVSLESSERRTLIEGAGFARYMPDGRLLFVRGGRVYAVGLDTGRMAVAGTPEMLLDAVRYDWRNGGTHLAVSRSGVLVYGPGEPISHDHYLSWLDARGTFTRSVDEPRRFRDPASRPDGQRIAAIVGSSSESDLWSIDANATLSRLTFGLSPYRPTWTADGRGITVGSRKDGTWRLLTVPADGGEPAVLLESRNRLYPDAWLPDGRHLLFQENRPETGWDLYALPIDEAGRPAGAPKAFAASPAHEGTAAISPDGRWVAYESDELDGVVQVYVRSWPEGAHKIRASAGGARWPMWGAGGVLYFWQTGSNGILQMVQTRATGGQLTITEPAPVWKGDAATAVRQRAVITVLNARFDVDRAKGRFLILERPIPATGPELTSPVVVLGAGPAR